VLRQGSDVLLLTVGPLAGLALEAAEQLSADGIHASVVSIRRLRPLDIDVLCPLITAHRAVITVEDNVLAGGFGSAILELMADQGISRPIERLGLPDAFVGQGQLTLLRRDVGLTTEAAKAAAMRLLGRSDVSGS
jgi:1-deoxy-D-xylulose-5-phosphate synthase